MVEGVEQRVRIGYRRDDNGYTTGGHHRFVIALPQFAGQVFVVTSDADNRLALCGRILRIDIAKMGLQIESVSHSECRFS